MIEQIDRFRELIIFGKRGGKFYLPTSTGRIVQMNFTRDPITKRYILQCYTGNDWLWTSNSKLSKDLVKDFDEIIYQYTDI